jgi:transaldolase
MKPTQQLHDLGQSLWVDNITRDLLTSGTLRRYVDEFLVTGLTTKVVRVAVNITSRNDFVLTAADCLAV